MDLLQISFRNMQSSPIVEEWIRAEVAKLETFYKQIRGCRVAVDLPHRHHAHGPLYHIRIDLTLPGGEVVIKHEASLTDRARRGGEPRVTKRLEAQMPHKNLRQAVDDAFKAAGRRLQDYARRRRGDVKTHELPAVAHVSKLFPNKGYGFLTRTDGQEVYFHEKSVLNGAFRRLRVGTGVSFVEEPGEKGLQASTVRIARSPKTGPVPESEMVSA